MNTEKKILRNIAPLVVMTVFTFGTASMLFLYVVGNPGPVPVFVAFCVIQCAGFVLFAILPDRFRSIPRHASKILIGAFLLVLAGIMGRQNFQIEGFFYQLMAGFFGGALLHFIMKITGTLTSGRSWCSWGCWTAAFLDFLPYKTGTAWKPGKARLVRYLHFLLSAAVVALMYLVFGHVMQSTSSDPSRNWHESSSTALWMGIGNLVYYVSGTGIAIAMKDNRAFCKYLCPVAVLLKGAGIFSVARIRAKKGNCSDCGKCESVCLSAIAIRRYTHSGVRVASTECIMCLSCVAACPEENLEVSTGFDRVTDEFLIQNQSVKKPGPEIRKS